MSKPSQDSNLDILRSIAVLAVFATHALQVMAGLKRGDHIAYGVETISLGLVGVLVFFVHTSLVLMQSLERSSTNLVGWPLTKYFYTRRAFRIYPLSICLILLCIALSIPPNALGVPYRSFRLGWLLSNLLLIQNLTGARDVSDPLWSLPYEVQMYLALPMLFLALRAGKGHLRIILIYVEGALISMAHSILQYLPCFLSGVVAYDLLKTVRPRFPAWLWTPMIIGAIVIFTATSHSDSTNWGRAFMCLFVGLSIPLFHRNCGAVAAVAAIIAKYSYGIYLCHTPILWLIYHKLALPTWQRPILSVIGTGVASWACFHAIEHPLIQAGTQVAEWMNRDRLAHRAT
jgi:peptidoglycan/LPS O-acetylase OafA/YrhL